MHSIFRPAFHLVMWCVLSWLACACGSGAPAAAHEMWTVAELLTKGERSESTEEVKEVRNCDAPEIKTITCSAGISNNLSVSLGVGASVGEAVEIAIDSSVSTKLGFNRNSGESLTLETPPLGSIYRYVIAKEYRILSGQVLVRSPEGEDQEGTYSFQADCSLRIKSIETVPCPENKNSSPSWTPSAGPSLVSTSVPSTNTPTALLPEPPPTTTSMSTPTTPAPTRTSTASPTQPPPTHTTAPSPTQPAPTDAGRPEKPAGTPAPGVIPPP